MNAKQHVQWGLWGGKDEDVGEPSKSSTGGGSLVAMSLSDSWNSMDCSPPGSSVSGLSQAKILEWVAISFSRGSCRPGDRTRVSCIASVFSTNPRDSREAPQDVPRPWTRWVFWPRRPAVAALHAPGSRWRTCPRGHCNCLYWWPSPPECSWAGRQTGCGGGTWTGGRRGCKIS